MSRTGDLYALLIGINDYGEAMPRLQFAVADVLSIREFLRERMDMKPNNCSILTFPDTGSGVVPQRNHVLAELDRFSNAPMGPDDTFILYFAGHGFARDEASYLLAVDSNPGSSNLLRQTAVSLETVQDFLSEVRAGQQLLILDACRNEPSPIARATASAGMDAVMARDIKALAQSAVREDRREERPLRARAILSACSQGQASYEYAKGRQGWFCHNLLGVLRDHPGRDIEVVELSERVRQRMKHRAWQELPPAAEQEPYLEFQGRRPLRLRMRPRLPSTLPSAAIADPPKVQIKEISVAPLEVAIERVAVPQVAIPGLPPIPGDILELEGLLAGLEHTISSLGDGTHPSLRVGQVKVAEGQRQWEQLKADLETHAIRLPRKWAGIRGKFAKKSKNWLAGEILASPTRSLAELCTLFPELPRDEVLPYIHRVRNTELARNALEAARKQYEDGRTRKIVELDQKAKEIRTKLRTRQEEDLSEVLEITLEPYVDSGKFPAERWPELEVLLVQRRYAHEPLRLLERAEQCYKNLTGPSGMFRLAFSYLKGRRGAQGFAKGLTWMLKSAELGNRTAQSNMGRLYWSGQGVPQDFMEAAKWFRKAAEQGDPAAQYGLGLCYTEGKGVTKDEAKALKWFCGAAQQGNADAVERLRKIAEQGNAVAQLTVGECYAGGKGVTKDEAEAVNWLRKAADLGDPVAQCKLGICFAEGEAAEAAKWFRKAAEQGYADAQYWLGLCYKDELGVKRDDKKAVECLRKAAEQGHAAAELWLGRCYERGILGVAKISEKAVEWLRKAAEHGNADAQCDLGSRYDGGWGGVPKDRAKAAEWFRKAANQGHAGAQFHLGLWYHTEHGNARYGEGQPLALEAVKWLQKAAEQGHVAAQYWLGCLVYGGWSFGVSHDDAKATYWLRKAAEHELVKDWRKDWSDNHYVHDAQWELAKCYAQGRGVSRDSEEASKWFHEAHRNKQKDAETLWERRSRESTEPWHQWLMKALGGSDAAASPTPPEQKSPITPITRRNPERWADLLMACALLLAILTAGLVGWFIGGIRDALIGAVCMFVSFPCCGWAGDALDAWPFVRPMRSDPYGWRIAVVAICVVVGSVLFASVRGVWWLLLIRGS
jgi:TPR repeat protein